MAEYVENFFSRIVTNKFEHFVEVLSIIFDFFGNGNGRPFPSVCPLFVVIFIDTGDL